MVNTDRYVLNKRKAIMDDIIFRVNSLYDKGIVIKPSASTEIIGINNGQDIGYLIGPDYEDIRDAISDIFHSGIDINYTEEYNYKKIINRQVDHNKTRDLMVKIGTISDGKNISDACAYLDNIKCLGIDYVSSKSWDDLISKSYFGLLNNPIHEIKLASYSGKLITRCLPGWSNTHLEPMYKLQQGWVSGDEIEEVVREEMKNGLDITDGLCRKCYEYMLKMN